MDVQSGVGDLGTFKADSVYAIAFKDIGFVRIILVQLEPVEESY
jgi:hypothetical protein